MRNYTNEREDDDDDDDSKTNLFSPSAVRSLIGKKESREEGGRAAGIAARSDDSSDQRLDCRQTDEPPLPFPLPLTSDNFLWKKWN